MSKVLLETKNLKKYFETSGGRLHAVDGISIAIREGETLGVVGESGCGKSTLGRVLLRLLEATGGEVIFNGENILAFQDKKMRELRKQMQIIFQDPYSSLDPRMTVRELIAHPLKVNRVVSGRTEQTRRVRELMETVGLAERIGDAYPHELDGGRRQRIGIARALALNPRFIVCDEPVSALDVSIQAQILNLLMELQQSMGLTYLFITHNLSVVKHISNEIAVMYLGQCVEKCSSRELFSNPKHPYTRALLDAIPRIKIRGERRKRPVQGELVSPVNPPTGCRFAPRCPYARDACTGRELIFQEIAPEHYVSCRLYEN